MSLLPIAQLALNIRPSSAIGEMSQFFLCHGYELYPLEELTPTTKNLSQHSGCLSAIKYIQRLKEVQDFAQAAMASSQQNDESNANRFPR